MIKLNKIKIHLFKYKNKNPVLSSFGRMTFRSSLVVELIDQNDNSGFGEIWCNFPNHAGRYRFEIFKDYFVNLLKLEIFFEILTPRLDPSLIGFATTGNLILLFANNFFKLFLLISFL